MEQGTRDATLERVVVERNHAVAIPLQDERCGAPRMIDVGCDVIGAALPDCRVRDGGHDIGASDDRPAFNGVL
jgi:hypothetical protein